MSRLTDTIVIMVHVSKNKLSAEVQSKMYDQLADLFVANTRKSEFSKTLFELLTPSERTMLAKRVGIIGMIIYGHNSRDISIMFKVSTSTIFSISTQLEDGKFKHIKAIFKRKKYRQSFLGILETIATLGTGSLNPQKKVNQEIRRSIESFKAGG